MVPIAIRVHVYSTILRCTYMYDYVASVDSTVKSSQYFTRRRGTINQL